MSKKIVEKLNELVKDGFGVLEKGGGDGPWMMRVSQILETAISKESADCFMNFTYSNDVLEGIIGNQIGYLESLVLKFELESEGEEVFTAPKNRVDNTKVFIVHGHDIETKETVARFIQKIGLVPIILHEQPSSGRTIIEKLEAFSDVGFAVVLLTPDDIGSVADEQQKLNKRARQNVILELGYFLGRLARNRVCALYRSEVEIPSDYAGVLFIELDTKGAWRTKLAQEFVHAGLVIDIQGLLAT